MDLEINSTASHKSTPPPESLLVNEDNHVSRGDIDHHQLKLDESMDSMTDKTVQRLEEGSDPERHQDLSSLSAPIPQFMSSSLFNPQDDSLSNTGKDNDDRAERLARIEALVQRIKQKKDLNISNPTDDEQSGIDSEDDKLSDKPQEFSGNQDSQSTVDSDDDIPTISNYNKRGGFIVEEKDSEDEVERRGDESRSGHKKISKKDREEMEKEIQRQRRGLGLAPEVRIAQEQTVQSFLEAFKARTALSYTNVLNTTPWEIKVPELVKLSTERESSPQSISDLPTDPSFDPTTVKPVTPQKKPVASSPLKKTPQMRNPVKRLTFNITPRRLASYVDNSDDSELEIVPSTKVDKVSKPLRTLTNLARVNISPRSSKKTNGKKSLTQKELMSKILQEQREQVLKERAEKVEAIKARGGEILTEQQKERETGIVESLLMKAQREADEVKQRDNEAQGSRNDDGTDSEWDEEMEIEDGFVHVGESESEIDEEVEDLSNEFIDEEVEVDENGEDDEDDEGEDDEGDEDEDEDEGEDGDEDGDEDVDFNSKELHEPEMHEPASPALVPNLAGATIEVMSSLADEEDDENESNVAPSTRRKKILVADDSDADDQYPLEVVENTQDSNFAFTDLATLPTVSQMFSSTIKTKDDGMTATEKMDALREKTYEGLTDVNDDLGNPDVKVSSTFHESPDSPDLPNRSREALPSATPLSQFPDPTPQSPRLSLFKSPSVSPKPKMPPPRLHRLISGTQVDDAQLHHHIKKKAKRDTTPFDRTKSKARLIVEDEAEESDDEWAGLGGVSDDSGAEDSGADLADLVDDVTKENVNKAEVQKLFADNERDDDSELVNMLFEDVANGGWRRKRAQKEGRLFDGLSDSEDEDYEKYQLLRLKRQQELKRRRLLEEENISAIVNNPKAKAFIDEIADEGPMFDPTQLIFLDEASGDEYEQDQSQDGPSLSKEPNSNGDPPRSNITVKSRKPSESRLEKLRRKLSFLDEEQQDTQPVTEITSIAEEYEGNSEKDEESDEDYEDDEKEPEIHKDQGELPIKPQFIDRLSQRRSIPNESQDSITLTSPSKARLSSSISASFKMELTQTVTWQKPTMTMSRSSLKSTSSKSSITYLRRPAATAASLKTRTLGTAKKSRETIVRQTHVSRLLSGGAWGSNS